MYNFLRVGGGSMNATDLISQRVADILRASRLSFLLSIQKIWSECNLEKGRGGIHHPMEDA